jgi:hypothetical protein
MTEDILAILGQLGGSMKKSLVSLICGLFSLTMGLGVSSRQGPNVDSAAAKLIETVRLINTEEISYRHDVGRYASREEMLGYLRDHDYLKRSPIDLINLKGYDLSITATNNSHFQVAVKPISQETFQSTCAAAAFSDETGIIFLGNPIGCPKPIEEISSSTHR